METSNTTEQASTDAQRRSEAALLGCHVCILDDDCHHPFKPLRPGRCNGDKYTTLQQREQYHRDMKEEREAEIRSEMRPDWST